MQSRVEQIFDAFLKFISSKDSQEINDKNQLEFIKTQTLLFIDAINEVSWHFEQISDKALKELDEKMQNIYHQLEIKKTPVNTPQINIDMNIPREDSTLLSMAVSMERVTIIRLLLEAKANPDCYDLNDNLPLTLAMRLEKGESKNRIIQLLMEAKANVLLRDNGRFIIRNTVFDYLQSEDTKFCELFINALSDPNEEELNQPPLHYAIKFGTKELVQSLLEKKADPDRECMTTPLGQAAYDNRHEIVSLLLNLPSQRTPKSIAEAYKYALKQKNLIIIKELLPYFRPNMDMTALLKVLNFYSLSDPNIFLCFNILIQQIKAGKVTCSEYESNEVKQYEAKLCAMNRFFSKKVYHSLEENLPYQIPHVLLKLIQEYDVPLEGRTDIKASEIDEYLKMDEDNYSEKKCSIQ